jgi:hypothetical protein
MEAYLVDAETSEQHPALTDGQRQWYIELATQRIYGELLPAEVDPLDIADEVELISTGQGNGLPRPAEAEAGQPGV